MVPTRLTLGDYQAWVLVEDQEVEHYGIEVNEEAQVATCWIASTEGKGFGIGGLKTHTNFDCCAFLTMDGSFAGGFYLFQTELRSQIRKDVGSGPQVVRPFAFGSLQLSDDDLLLDAPAKDIGEITVKIKRVTNISDPKDAIPPSYKVPEAEKVHERSKKAVAHRVQFGEECEGRGRLLLRAKPHETVATFVIRYRPLDMLRARGIAPPLTIPQAALPDEPSSNSAPDTQLLRKRKSPELKEEESEDEIYTDEAEERRREVELEAELERIRKARHSRTLDKSSKKRVKREYQPVFMPGEVIDLTI